MRALRGQSRAPADDHARCAFAHYACRLYIYKRADQASVVPAATAAAYVACGGPVVLPSKAFRPLWPTFDLDTELQVCSG